MMNKQFPRKAALSATKLLKALGNERRLLVLCHILDGEKGVSELEKLTGLSQSALSQHLAKLRHQHLVATRRQAQNIYYSLASFEVDQVIQLLHKLFCASPKGAEPPRKKSRRRNGRLALKEAGP
jgi:DNA-binding transcriptional ArsR family regulator